MKNKMQAYKTELNQQYWDYQKRQFPVWQRFFDRPQAQEIRPPVFKSSKEWRNVLVKPDASRQDINRLLALLPIADRHRWFQSMNSSQALAQSVLGNLSIYDLLGHLGELHDDDGMELFGNAQVVSANFSMEAHVNYLGEPRKTSLDGFIDGDYRVAIECKFAEAEIGTCSRPRLKPADSNYDRDSCNGTYTWQKARKERCPLTEIGVLYWQYVSQLFQWNNDQDLTPCPLNANYQFVRNILAIGVRPDGLVSPANGHVLLLYDERNPAFQVGGKGFTALTETRKALREPTMLRKCSWQRIVQHMRNRNILPWLTEQLVLKYGL